MSALALQHFQATDPILAQVWRLVHEKVGPIEVKAKPPEMFFTDLCDAIVGQQLSEKVAPVIWRRVLSLLNSDVITPAQVLGKSVAELRSVGVSNAKANYLRNLAQFAVERSSDLSDLAQLDNENVINELTKVKGIGRWTAEMFLIFTLGREDVFSYGDLGLRRAVGHWYTLPEVTSESAHHIIDQWSPYRSFASKALWKSLTLID